MASQSFLKGFIEYGAELRRELRSFLGALPGVLLRRRSASNPPKGDHRLRAILLAAALFVLFHQLYFQTGRVFLDSGALSLDNGIYGWDCPRSIKDMLVTGHNNRANVHPFFVIYAKPITRFYRQFFVLTDEMSAIAATAMIGGFSVVGVYSTFLVWGTGLLEAAIFASIFGSSMAAYLCGAAPETRVYSNFSLVVTFLMASLALRRSGSSQWAWLLTGIFTYGTTISNFAKTGMAFAVSAAGPPASSRWWARCLAYGGIVVPISIGLTAVSGGMFNLTDERWIIEENIRGPDYKDITSQLVRNFLFFAVVAPTPKVDHVRAFSTDNKIASFTRSTYKPIPLALAAIWGAMLVASLAVFIKDRRSDELRMLVILFLCLAMDFALFSQYYVPFEGIFVWTPHVIAAVCLLTLFFARRISNLSVRARAFVLGALLLFLLGETANNIAVTLETARLLQA